MKITFYVENYDYDEYVYIISREKEVKTHIKPGDILEKVQLHAYFIHGWGKEDTGENTKGLKHIKSDIYSFSGEITKIKKWEDIFQL